jgi:hypothetical protein
MNWWLLNNSKFNISSMPDIGSKSGMELLCKLLAEKFLE